jgi:hypothetical protein
MIVTDQLFSNWFVFLITKDKGKYGIHVMSYADIVHTMTLNGAHIDNEVSKTPKISSWYLTNRSRLRNIVSCYVRSKMHSNS